LLKRKKVVNQFLNEAKKICRNNDDPKDGLLPGGANSTPRPGR
jgi:hypothetical protein